MGETPLTRMLRDGTTRPDALTAFRAARRAFRAGRRIEMQELALELGVSRATLFRWVGSRDELLAEVIWSMTVATFEDVVSRSQHEQGAARVAGVLGDFVASTIRSRALMDFVQREPERAIRLLTTESTGFQARLQSLVQALLTEEIAAGRIDPPLPIADLAFLTLRLGEAFVYSDAIAGREPDPDMVRRAVRALLGG